MVRAIASPLFKNNKTKILHIDMSRTLLYVDFKSRVEYKGSKYYVNGQEKSAKDEEEAKSKAEEAVWAIMRDVVGKYTTTFTHIAVLTAAGTSMDNGANNGKTREGLWEHCKVEIEELTKELSNRSEGLKANIQKAADETDIETFLSLVMLDEKLNGEFKTKDGKKTRFELQKKIAEVCTLTLDVNNQHHGEFIRKLTARKPSDTRVQLFTTNYDTLFEQAAKKIGFTIIDGFSFSHPRIFNGTNFDFDIVYRERSRIKPDESFVPNVFQLYKLHGSVDWQRGQNGEVLQVEKTDTPCVIYPASNKYESSYEQPYIEMIARFQQTLRREGTLLIVVGFGFKDKHLQNIIKEAVFQNPYFHLLVVCYKSGITKELVPDFLDDDLNTMPNVTVIHGKFKDFVQHLPFNQSYDIVNPIITPNATI